eukprot:805431-Prymnesium_polylepis.1
MRFLSTPGMTTSRDASKHRSVGTPDRPVTPPQLESVIELCVSSHVEPHGVEHAAASRVLVNTWSAPPCRFQ